MNIYDLTLDKLSSLCTEAGMKPYKAKQVYKWLYNGANNPDMMTDISKADRKLLANEFTFELPRIIKKSISNDQTVKYLLELSDGNAIEAVLMKYKHGNSLCISTQVGCRMGCAFCASGIEGLVRNLNSGEITGQILAIKKDICDSISNIVMMGSGEPLDNFENVGIFLDNARAGLGIGARHITISTCGIAEKMPGFVRRNPQVGLSVSLHAPFDHIRRQLMPIAKAVSLSALFDAIDQCVKISNRRITLEYAMIADVNDDLDCARALSQLCAGRLVHVNLIPVNKSVYHSFTASEKQVINRFKAVLLAGGRSVTVRRTLGSDIAAACGLLKHRGI